MQYKKKQHARLRTYCGEGAGQGRGGGRTQAEKVALQQTADIPRRARIKLQLVCNWLSWDSCGPRAYQSLGSLSHQEMRK